jgi:hypothetical protein
VPYYTFEIRSEISCWDSHHSLQVNVCQRASIFTLVDLQARKTFCRARERNLGSRRIFLTLLAGHKKTISGPLFAHPCCRVWPAGTTCGVTVLMELSM